MYVYIFSSIGNKTFILVLKEEEHMSSCMNRFEEEDTCFHPEMMVNRTGDYSAFSFFCTKMGSIYRTKLNGFEEGSPNDRFFQVEKFHVVNLKIKTKIEVCFPNHVFLSFFMANIHTRKHDGRMKKFLFHKHKMSLFVTKKIK